MLFLNYNAKVRNYFELTKKKTNYVQSIIIFFHFLYKIPIYIIIILYKEKK